MHSGAGPEYTKRTEAHIAPHQFTREGQVHGWRFGLLLLFVEFWTGKRDTWTDF